MKEMIEKILRKVLGEMLGTDAIANVLKGVVEKVLTENQDWVKAIAGKVKAIADEQKAEAVEPEAAAETRQDGASAGVESDVEPAELDWCYGGFKGGKAVVSEDAVLEKATLKGDTLSFSWAKGDCRNIGATSKEDAGHTVACLFLQDGAGGKFEWISTSRKTRRN